MGHGICIRDYTIQNAIGTQPTRKMSTHLFGLCAHLAVNLVVLSMSTRLHQLYGFLAKLMYARLMLITQYV